MEFKVLAALKGERAEQQQAWHGNGAVDVVW